MAYEYLKPLFEKVPLSFGDFAAALDTAEGISIANLFQTTLPSRGATGLVFDCRQIFHISIHAPLAGSDFQVHAVSHFIVISIHAPLAGSDVNLLEEG